MKKRTVCLILLVFCILLIGCESRVMENPEELQKLIDRNIELTQKAIAEKDIRLAREIWSKISEYGIKAKEQDKEDLAGYLGKLASTYTSLVEYIETKDDEKLKVFQENFEAAIRELRECVQATSKKDDQA